MTKVAKRTSTPVKSKLSGPETFAAELRLRFADYPEVVYESGHFDHYGWKYWGVKASFVNPKVGDIVTMMNYHSAAKTQADVKDTVTLLEAD